MSEPRKATQEDIPFVAALGRAAYPQFPLDQAEAWLSRIMSMPNAAVFVCGNAVATVAAQVEFWRPDAPVSDVLPMFGFPSRENRLGVYRVLAAAAEWSRDMGCREMRFGSSVGAQAGMRSAVDLMEPFAKRLGAHPWGMTYSLEFEKCRPQFQ